MSTQQVTYCTTKVVNSCQGGYTNPSIICVPTARTATGLGFIEGTIKSISQGTGKCSTQCVYQYVIEYDDEQLNDPSVPLTSAEVTGLFCQDCYTAWLVNLIEPLTGWYTDTDGNFIQETGYTGSIIFDSDQGQILSNAETKSVGIGGGDSFSPTQGAYTLWHGVTHALYPGQVHTYLADTVGSFFGIFLPQATSSFAVLNSLSVPFWGIDGSGLLAQGLAGSDIVFTDTDGVIRSDTSLGADTKSVGITGGGGGTSASRGAYLLVRGNEYAGQEGTLFLVSGTGIAGNIIADIGLASGFFGVGSSGGAYYWKFERIDGSLQQDPTNGGDIIMSRAGTSIILGNTAIPSDVSDSRLYIQSSSSQILASLVATGANASPATIDLYKTRATDGTANIIVALNDYLGTINFNGAGGANYVQGAFIRAYVSGAPGGATMPSTLEFGTCASGGALGVVRWIISNTGTLEQNATNGNDIVFNKTSSFNSIRMGTTDGADNGEVALAGGGSASNSRGAYFAATGNEATPPGRATIACGNVANALIRLVMEDPTSSVDIADASAGNLWSFQNDGDFAQDGTNGGNVLLTKASTCVTPGTAVTGVSAAGSAIGDATDLTAVFTNITTCAPGQGVQVWDAPLNAMIFIKNSTGNACLVYPPSAAQEINGAGVGVARSMPGLTLGVLFKVTATNWIFNYWSATTA